MRAYEVRETTGLDGLVLNSARAEPQLGHCLLYTSDAADD